MIKEHRVEILMTTFNGALYLREQVESILAQTYTHWHLTLSDDDNVVNLSSFGHFERSREILILYELLRDLSATVEMTEGILTLR